MAVARDVDTRRTPLRRIDPWTAIAWLLPTALVLLAPLPTGDLAYQVRAGRLMISAHQFLRQDVFTYTFAGRPWIDQQWGAQLVFGALFPILGWRGFVVIRALLVGSVVGATFERTRSAGADAMVAGALSVGAFAVALLVPGSTVLRPQLLALPLFVFAAWILQRRRARPRWLTLLPFIGVVWANVHGSFVLLPLLLLTAAIDDVVQRDPIRPATVGLTLVCAITPLINPWGPSIYSYVVRLSTMHTIRSAVEEWQPLSVRWQTGVVFASATAVMLFLVARRRSRMPTPGEIAGWAAFSILAVVSGRNVIWWALYVPPVVGGVLSGWHPGSDRVDARTGTVLATIFVVIAAIGAIRIFTIQPATSLLGDAPAGVTAAVATGTAGGARLFDGSWGSWFEYALPNVPVFLDARGEMTPDDVYRDYSLVMSAQPGWNDVLDRWRVGVVAVPADDARLISMLNADPTWTRTYQDGDGSVYVRVT
jgi:hypothetical protein